MNKLLKGLRNPYKVLLRLLLLVPGLAERIDDKTYISIKYRAHMGKKINWDNPTTFNEKLQWLKLYDRKPEYSVMVDKYEVKNYVANIIGEEHIIPTLGVWDKFDDIDFDALPNQFVLKCTHDSGGLVICRDKDSFDIEKAKKKINECLKKNFYYRSREWPYKHVKPQIIAEKYMESNDSDSLIDYKFYCFNGEAKFLYVSLANIRNGVKKDLITYYDLNWDNVPFGRLDHEAFPFLLAKPKEFEKMIRIANMLSKGIPFLRVDLYWINNQIYFSELTFAPGGGFEIGRAHV